MSGDKTKPTGAFVEWHIECRSHWEDEVYGWFEPSSDSIIFQPLCRLKNDPYQSSRSPYGNWGIWYETYDEAVAAIQRFQDKLKIEDPWTTDMDKGDHYTEAQYEFRVRKFTYIIDEPIQITEEPHPALLKKRPGWPHWNKEGEEPKYGPIRRRKK